MSNVEKSSKKELLTIINQQNEKINRYETRLRDVVIAYKGLVKEKEALESSVKALSTPQQHNASSKTDKYDTDEKETESNNEVSSEVQNLDKKEDENQTEDEESDAVKQLHQQLTTLTNSLATLSAEKSRMEASFQADKKQLRLEKEERDKSIRDLQDKNQQAIGELENVKLKHINERHERDKEQNDHGAMIRELQKLLSDERHQVEILEMRCEELKSKVTQMEQQHSQSERKLRDFKNELESSRRKLKRAEAEIKSKEAPPLLFELQEEMANLKLHHQAAILQEQKRVAEAEERARKLAAMHEERVANLESRLAELSETVGTYDRLRQQDQAAITKLKDHIAQLDLENTTLSGPAQTISDFVPEELKENKEVDVNTDIHTVVEHIMNLKTQLLHMNQKSEKPIDMKTIFNTTADTDENIHKKCQDEILHLQNELEWHKKQQPSINEEDDTTSLVNALKERIQLLNAQMSDGEENKQHIENLQKMLKAEKARSKSELAAVETDYRCRVSLLEQQLQKQRERSLMLLEDKEQEIRMLKSSFGMFLPGSKAGLSNTEQIQETNTASESMVKAHFGFHKSTANGGESPHMLHYAHEIARRDVEISNLRKANHRLESSLRELGRSLASEEEAHQERENELKEEVARLERCQSREGANLEYLKNVVLSFLTSNDSNCKRHMLNAIAAVLKFSGAEFERVNRIHKTPIQPAAR